MVSIDFINFYDVSNTDVSNSEEELVTEEDNTESKQNPSDYYRSTNVTGSQSEAENDALADDKNGIKIKKKEFRNYLPSADSNGEVDDFENGRAKLNDLKKKALHISNGKGDVNSLFYPLHYATREQKGKNADNCNEEDL